jgi:hypothetical protein
VLAAKRDGHHVEVTVEGTWQCDLEPFEIAGEESGEV